MCDPHGMSGHSDAHGVKPGETGGRARLLLETAAPCTCTGRRGDATAKVEQEAEARLDLGQRDVLEQQLKGCCMPGDEEPSRGAEADNLFQRADVANRARNPSHEEAAGRRSWSTWVSCSGRSSATRKPPRRKVEGGTPAGNGWRGTWMAPPSAAKTRRRKNLRGPQRRRSDGGTAARG